MRLLLAVLVLASCSKQAVDVQSWPLALTVSPETTPRYERVILVTIDTLRPDHMSCYGYARNTTPFLDSLAEQGARFTRVLSTISHTAPAHATILTGLPPATHGLVANGMRLDRRAVGLAQLFGEAGYETAAFFNVRFLEGVSGGFDTAQARPNQGHRVIDAATQWLQGERKSDRFFLWLHLYDPHHWNQDKLTPKAEIIDIRRSSPWSADALYEEIETLHAVQHLDPPIPKERVVAWIDAYDGHILRADRLVERFHDAVLNEGLAEDTLWVITSDHGEGLGSHAYAGHTERIYNEQLLVPLIVYASNDSIRPRVIDQSVQHVDFLPTFAEILGAEVNGIDPELDGRSFLPLLKGRATPEARTAFSERAFLEELDSLFGLQTDDYKLLVHGAGGREFYDLRSDPHELNNLGTTEESNRFAEQLNHALKRMRARRPPLDPTADMAGQDVPDEWREELRALGYAE